MHKILPVYIVVILFYRKTFKIDSDLYKFMISNVLQTLQTNAQFLWNYKFWLNKAKLILKLYITQWKKGFAN